MMLNDPFFLRGSLHGVLLCWFNILYRSRRILAEDVRQFRGYHRSRDGRAHGNDFRHLCLRPRKVRSKYYPTFVQINETNWNQILFFLRFTKDIEEMTGYRPGAYWQFTWRFLAPIIMVCILVSSIISMVVKKPQYSAWDASRVSSGKYYLVTHISRCQNTYVTTSTFLPFFFFSPSFVFRA